MTMNKTYLFLISLMVLAGCGNGDDQFDATGNFEADETIISSEAAGKILQFNIQEGQTLKAGEVVGYIDTLQLRLKKKQLQLSAKAVMARQPDTAKQLATIREQIETAKKEKARFESLLKDDAATQKQVDDLTAQLALLQKQYDALQSSLNTTTSSLQSEVKPIEVQVEQLQDQIRKSQIINPVNGTVLVKYAEENEVTAPGKALYKIANLSDIILRAYITGTQLPEIKLNQEVEVLVDNSEGGYKTYKGVVTWVSDKAEFTPKTIQTKEERANLVYAIKIKVKNDGYLKLGMYGEVNF
ncbi:MAG TPA: HlyD family efflux transporter periplasmic adaptor subunit [Cyclobacteriaceae bacterium]|nr:HlyD family efflux transporter periplasmic adaptor subunit [Cyclobacteriaceae bacterium]